MSLHKQPDLKNAILGLPPKEKDKLLVRLIGKDKLLMKQLHYQLLETEVDLEERIVALKEALRELLDDAKLSVKNVPTYSNFRALMLLIRQASGLINEHEKVTKDKFSEVECRIYLLKEAFQRYPHLFKAAPIEAAFKLRKYAQGRIKNAFTKYDKLHEDLQFDLQDDFQAIHDFALDHHLD